MVHRNAPTPAARTEWFSLGVNFSSREYGLVSCRPLDQWDDGLQSVMLRLSGPSGARVEHLQSMADAARLRWGGLVPGWWTAEAQGLDAAGRAFWRASQVRFRTADDGVAQLCLNFCRFGGDH